MDAVNSGAFLGGRGFYPDIGGGAAGTDPFTQYALVDGTRAFTGGITVTSDADVTTILGRVRLDSRTTDVAHFSHFDNATTTTYAVKQLANGTTMVNTATGTTLQLCVNNTGVINIVAGTVTFVSSNIISNGDNTNDVGGSGNRWRRGFFAEYFEISEMTAPAAPAADKCRLFVQDNASGKTQLMAIFSSGAAQQVAIQP